MFFHQEDSPLVVFLVFVMIMQIIYDCLFLETSYVSFLFVLSEMVTYTTHIHMKRAQMHTHITLRVHRISEQFAFLDA